MAMRVIYSCLGPLPREVGVLPSSWVKRIRRLSDHLDEEGQMLLVVIDGAWDRDTRRAGEGFVIKSPTGRCCTSSRIVYLIRQLCILSICLCGNFHMVL